MHSGTPPIYPYMLEKYEKYSNFDAFKIANKLIVVLQFLAYRQATTKLETLQTILICSKNTKITFFYVCDIANNIITGIPFLPHRIALNKLGILDAPWRPPNYPLICTKNKKNNCNFTIFKIANKFIMGMKLVAYRLATEKLGNLQAPKNTPQPTLLCSKKKNI